MSTATLPQHDVRTTHRHRARNTRRTLRLVTTAAPRPGTTEPAAVRLHPVDLGPWDD